MDQRIRTRQAFSPDGRFLYGANRGHDSIVVLAFEDLEPVGWVKSGGRTPRHFSLDPTGEIMVVLFNSEAAYGGQGAPVAQAMIDVAAGQHTATFTVPAGDYAVKSFHDVNGDGRMNTNPFGMPTEPYAFSNNARGNMGPATWEQAHFTVEGDTAQTISLR